MRGRGGIFRGRGGFGGRGGFRKKGGRAGPSLPLGLLDHVRSSSGPSGADHLPNNRKAARKAARDEKKQNRAAHYNQQQREEPLKLNNFKKVPPAPSNSNASSGGANKKRVRFSSDRDESSSSRGDSSVPFKKPRLSREQLQKRGYEFDDDDDEGDDQDDLVSDSASESDIEDDDDDDDVEDDLADRARKVTAEDDEDEEEDEDAKIIARLEKKLGIKKGSAKAAKAEADNDSDNDDGGDYDDAGDSDGGSVEQNKGGKDKKKTRGVKDAERKKRKLYKEFAEDGLGEDFGEFLEGLESRIDADAVDYRPPREVEGEGDEEGDKDMDDDEEEDDSDSQAPNLVDGDSDDGGEDEEDGEGPLDDEDGEESDDFSDMDDGLGEGSDDDSDSEDAKPLRASGEPPSSSGVTAAAAAAAAAAAGGKYVPPHLRGKLSASSNDGAASSSNDGAASSSGKSAAAGADTRFATLSRKGAFLYGREEDADSDDDGDNDEEGGGSSGNQQRSKQDKGWDLAVPVTDSPAVQALRRRMQGLMNRLGESNIEPIAGEIAGLYASHPTAECNHVLLGLVLEQCGSHTQVLRPLVMVFGALISALHVTVGPGVGAFVIEQLTLRFADAAGLPRKPQLTSQELADSAAALDSGPDASNGLPKLRNNLLLLLSYLYVFQVAHPDLLAGILRLLAARFCEADAELLLLSLTYAGFQLRTDDPAALRDILKAVHDKVAATKQQQQQQQQQQQAAGAKPASSASSTSDSSGGLSALIAKFTTGGADASSASASPASASAPPSLSRQAVLSELIMDLKNNRKRSEHEQLLERGSQLRKWLSRLAAKSGGGLEGIDRRIRIGWSDVMMIPQRGRWWLVGASWAGRAAADDRSGGGGGLGAASVLADGSGAAPSSSSSAAAASSSSASSSQEAALMDAARAMRMNTPARKAVFVALMGAEDGESALDRLLRLNLKGPAEREIVRVLLDCAAQEASYNPFYASVGNRLCSYHPRFKFTFQLAFWDAFKTIGDGASTPRRLYNEARLLAAMVAGGSVSLAVAKTLDFTTSDAKQVLFLKAFLTSLLLEAGKTADVRAIFTRLGNGADRLTLRDGLSVALHRYIKTPGLVAAAEARRVAGGSASAAAAAGSALSSPAALQERLKAAKRALESVTGTAEEEVMGM